VHIDNDRNAISPLELSEYIASFEIDTRLVLDNFYLDLSQNLSRVTGILQYCPDVPSPNLESGPRTIGRVWGHLLNVGRVKTSHLSVIEVMESANDAMMEFYGAVFAGDEWAQSVVDATDGLASTLLIVHMMEIEAEHRGRGLGLRFMEALLDSTFIPSSTLVLMRPFAAGHEDDMVAQAAATRKVAAYWKRAGFQRLPCTEHLIRFIE